MRFLFTLFLILMHPYFKYWLNMKRISILVVLVLVGSFVTTQLLGKSKMNLPPDRYEKIMFLIGRMLSDGHYSPQAIDNAFSKRVFERYLSELDPEKNIFLKGDIESLRIYENKIDIRQ